MAYSILCGDGKKHEKIANEIAQSEWCWMFEHIYYLHYCSNIPNDASVEVIFTLTLSLTYTYIQEKLIKTREKKHEINERKTRYENFHSRFSTANKSTMNLNRCTKMAGLKLPALVDLFYT